MAGNPHIQAPDALPDMQFIQSSNFFLLESTQSSISSEQEFLSEMHHLSLKLYWNNSHY